MVTAVLAGISKLAKHLETFYDLLASLDKLGTLTDLPGEAPGGEPPPDSKPARIVVRAPHFNLEVAPQQKVGLCGVSGSGILRALRTFNRA